MTVEELSAPPRLGPLYRAAALRRGSGRRSLPDRELALAGIAVDLAHLADYGRVCGFRLRDDLPATYLHVVAFPLALSLMTRADFPFPLLGLVHVANRVTLRRPLSVEERFDLRVRAADLRPHDRGTRVDVVATASVGGAEVWEGRSTYLHRTSKGAGRTGERPEPPAATARWRVERRVGPDYAAVSGDRNPIHTSRLLARAFGFSRTIAHGMWSKARCLAALEGRLPDRYSATVDFKLPILLPAQVAFSSSASGSDVRFALHDAQSGRPHLAGTVTEPE